jgi:RimJ/RimL family protein N-acetyltransferase
MPTIELTPLDDITLADLSDAPARYAAARGLDLGPYADTVQHVARQTRAFVLREGIRPLWGGYLVVDPATRSVVGTCGYKGPPDGRSEVEIASFTFPTYEGRGYATAMAAALKLGFQWVPR